MSKKVPIDYKDKVEDSVLVKRLMASSNRAKIVEQFEEYDEALLFDRSRVKMRYRNNNYHFFRSVLLFYKIRLNKFNKKNRKNNSRIIQKIDVL